MRPQLLVGGRTPTMFADWQHIVVEDRESRDHLNLMADISMMRALKCWRGFLYEDPIGCSDPMDCSDLAECGGHGLWQPRGLRQLLAYVDDMIAAVQSRARLSPNRRLAQRSVRMLGISAQL